jgi:hypothetical protein
MDKDILDIEYLRAMESFDEKVSEHEQLENEINSEKELQHIVEEELKDIDTTRPKISKNKMLQDIKGKRYLEKEKLRDKEAWNLDVPSETVEVNEETIEAIPDLLFNENLEEDNSVKSLLKRRRSGLFNGRG